MLLALGPRVGAQPAPPDDCLAYVTTNLATGNGNWHGYLRFANTRLTVKPGDVLTYRILLDPRNPEPKGGIDADFEDGGTPLRDLGLRDERGVPAHGDGDLSAAKGKWLTRKIDLSAAKGRTIVSWSLAEEGDAPGRYAQFIDDVAVVHADGARTVIYERGQPPLHEVSIANGYTKNPACAAIPAAQVTEGGDLDPAIATAERLSNRLAAIDSARRDLDLAREFAERAQDDHVKQHVTDAAAALTRTLSADATEADLQAALHTAGEAVAHAHPAMQSYTGHLVGHAHIDLQWLWEWQEGIVFTHDTFAQAVKFMDEFPGFTFSQSSSCLYQAMEEHYPALFDQIKSKVAGGQWELVGGRICEGDTNMISEESTARQFLYGQTYFRERFNRTAVVGWEPDTFGHTFQMPQILKQGGCEYYYFCRGGKGKPLFWWQGLDGTRILAFDEPASGSWYNSDLSYKQFQEMLDFEQSAGSKDSLCVYGVGNHGGGPTREQIRWALDQMKSGTKPTVRFSTATEFFKKLETYDLSKIPVVHEELNPVFDGCYTSHSEIKQRNRRAEAMTSSAEAVAAVASLSGFKYPREALRRNWEDTCFNHHHDTLPGSGIHAGYDRTCTVLDRVVADDHDIITRALETLVIRVTPKGGGNNVLVFNPNGWTRSGWIETCLVRSGWDKTAPADPEHCIAEAPDGKTYPATLEDKPSKRVRFWAADVPPFGYRVFRLISGDAPRPALALRDQGATVETASLIVEFDKSRGCIKRLLDKSSGKELCGPGLGRLEAHLESNHHMSAWTLGAIERVEALPPTATTFTRGVDFAEAAFTYVLPAWNDLGRDSTITQTFRVHGESPQIDCDVDCSWNGVGSRQTVNPMLRVAFDTALDKPTATYHIPFGALSRPATGQEWPALQWADLSDSTGGLAVLNDSKHGYAAKGSTLTLSLIRSCYEPDPVPNPGDHHWRYAIVPHAEACQEAGLPQRAAAFNQPLLSASIPYDAHGGAPLEWTLYSAPETGAVIATGLKLAEKSDAFVLRMYEGAGRDEAFRATISGAPTSVAAVNFLEDELWTKPSPEGHVDLPLRPFEIRTIRFSPPATPRPEER